VEDFTEHHHLNSIIYVCFQQYRLRNLSDRFQMFDRFGLEVWLDFAIQNTLLQQWDCVQWEALPPLIPMSTSHVAFRSGVDFEQARARRVVEVLKLTGRSRVEDFMLVRSCKLGAWYNWYMAWHLSARP
jgi:hypothetical protein